MPPRKKSPVKISEAQIIKSCVEYLQFMKIVHWKNHVLNGTFKGFGQSKSYVVKTGIKGMGDMSIPLTNGSGLIMFIEFKTETGSQSQDQKDFEKFCIANGIPYFIVRSVEDLKEILSIYNII